MRILASIAILACLLLATIWWIGRGGRPSGPPLQPTSQVEGRDKKLRDKPSEAHRESVDIIDDVPTLPAKELQGAPDEVNPIEALTARLDEYRERYSNLTAEEYEAAIALARQCKSHAITRAFDERQRLGMFDKDVVVPRGETVEPPEKSKERGRTSTRVISTPVDAETQNIQFIVVYHKEEPEVAALEKELAWLNEQVAALRGR